MIKKRRAAHNSVYVTIAGEVVNRRSVLLRNYVLNRQISASNPLLHIHANRWCASTRPGVRSTEGLFRLRINKTVYVIAFVSPGDDQPTQLVRLGCRPTHRAVMVFAEWSGKCTLKRKKYCLLDGLAKTHASPLSRRQLHVPVNVVGNARRASAIPK